MTDNYDIVCFSHLRWDFVFQRPQHLLTRFSRERRVFYVEEPVYTEGKLPTMTCSRRETNLYVVTPHLPTGLAPESQVAIQMRLIDDLISTEKLIEFVAWYYTPLALKFTRTLRPVATVYDCMDELSLFKFAPAELTQLEAELFKKADVVFTGGQTLYEAKKFKHPNIFPFPSSIDKAHFGQARSAQDEPADQKHISHPRMGFFGVVDERFDIELLREAASRRPEWQFVIIGPVVKIDPATLPQSANIHYLGGKSYKELPSYIAGWDVALLPFALNDSTKFISPTKTPEYLAAGRPVVSTPIRDVVCPYGDKNLVKIARTAGEFVSGIEECLELKKHPDSWLGDVDAFLSDNSWDKTFKKMASRVDDAIEMASQRKMMLAPRMHRPSIRHTEIRDYASGANPGLR